MKKKCLLIILIFAFVITIFPLSANAADSSSGSCGKNLSWSFSNGTLTISGTGKMDDYNCYYFLRRSGIPVPWMDLQIKTVIISPGVESIGNDAFYSENELTSVSISDTVRSIGKSAFSHCDSLETVDIPFGVVTIDEGAFYCCENLKSVSMPDTLKIIGNSAFYECTSLEEVSIPSSVVSIDLGAFCRCFSLKQAIIAPGVSEIGSIAFSDCRSLETVSIPNTVTDIGSLAFDYTPWFDAKTEDFVIVGDGVLISYNGFEKYSIPFADSGYRSAVTIPKGVKQISSAFYSCRELTGITIPSSTTVIGEGAFCMCENLKYVKMTDSVTEIRDGAFQACTSLKSIELPDCVKSIGDCAFNMCDSLCNLKLPSQLLELGESAFGQCSSITSVTIPAALKKIGFSSFAECHSLSSVVFQDGCTTVGRSMFSECENLTNISLPDSLIWIEGRAFWGCSSLADISIPAGISAIEDGVFEGTKWLDLKPGGFILAGDNVLVAYKGEVPDNLVIPEGVRHISDFLFYESTISSLSLPETLQSIAHEAFMDCTNLHSVTLPKSVSCLDYYSIGYYTFNKEFMSSNVVPISGFEIKGYSGSASEQYAKEAGLTFISIGKLQPSLENLGMVTKYMGELYDISNSQWYYQSVVDAYECGIISGKSENSFDPLGSLSIAEAIKMAAALRSCYNADGYEFRQGSPWYQTYVDYAVSKGIIGSGDFSDYTAKATRAQMAYIFAKALPAAEYNPINTVSSLPDVAESDIYGTEIFRLYRAGVLTGSNTQGSFKPESTISRAEAAAIISRVAMPEQRRTFSLM